MKLPYHIMSFYINIFIFLINLDLIFEIAAQIGTFYFIPKYISKNTICSN